MKKKIPEAKVVEALASLLDNYWFNPKIFANLIVNEYPLYTQDKLTELIVEIVRYQKQRFSHELEHGETSSGLLFSEYIGSIIEANEGSNGQG
jgi:hypothetical protein